MPSVPAKPRATDRLIEAMAILGAGAGAGDLAKATGLSPRTVSKHLGRLREAGMVAGSERAPVLTLAGRARTVPRPPVAGGSWEEVIAGLWNPWHAALARLLADAIVARHLAPGRPGHPGFVAYGPPHTYKSAVAAFVCDMFGLDRSGAIALLPRLAPGEVVGRRRQDEAGWVFEPVPRTRLPFACLDELADADPPVRREAFAYLHGDAEVEIEGCRIRLAPTVLVCFNPPERGDPLSAMPAAIWRRCLRLGTGALEGHLAADMPARLRSYERAPKPSPLELGALRWGADELDGDDWSIVDGPGGLYAHLSERGRTWHDQRTIETLALGRAAWTGVPVARATLEVAHDVLALAETVPDLVSNDEWRLALSALASDRGAPPAGTPSSALAVLAERRVTFRDQVAARRRESEAADLNLLGRRAAVAEAFRVAAKAIERVPEAHRPVAKGIRAQLGRLAVQAGDARSREGLEEVAELGKPVMAAAGELRRHLDAERQAATDQRRRAADQARAAKAARAAAVRAERERREAHSRQRRQVIAARDKALRELDRLLDRKTTRPGENVLGRLVELGVVVRQDRQHWRDVPQGPIGWLFDKPPRQTLVTTTWWVDADETWHRGSDLATWQAAGTRAALRARRAALDGSRPAMVPSVRELLPGAPGHPYRALPPPA